MERSSTAMLLDLLQGAQVVTGVKKYNLHEKGSILQKKMRTLIMLEKTRGKDTYADFSAAAASMAS